MKNLQDLDEFKRFFDNKLDWNSPTHLKDNYNLDNLKDDFKSFILSDRQEVLKMVLENLPEENPNSARIAQNGNGMDYCSTCEQAWEYCSCSARNRGNNDCLCRIKQVINNLKNL